jgi:hypothetical protein
VTLFEMLCIGGAALAAVLAAGRLLVNEIRETEDGLEPDLAAASGQQPAAPVKKKATPLVECEACHRRYSVRAVICPHCGQPPRVNDRFSVVPLILLGLACIAYTASFGPDEDGNPVPAWSQAPALQKLRAALIHELEDQKIIAAIRVEPHVVTVEVAKPAFRALQQFEQQTIGGTVFGYYFDGQDESDFVRLEDAESHTGLGWFNRWGLRLAEATVVAHEARQATHAAPPAPRRVAADPSPIIIAPPAASPAPPAPRRVAAHPSPITIAPPVQEDQ